MVDALTSTSSISANDLSIITNALDKDISCEFSFKENKTLSNGYIYPLKNANFFLLQTFPAKANQEFVNASNTLGILFWITLLVIFILFIGFILFHAHTRQKRTEMKNRAANYIMKGSQQVFDEFILVDFETQSYEFLHSTLLKTLVASSGSYENFLTYIQHAMLDKSKKDEFMSFFALDNLRQHLQKDSPNLTYGIHISLRNNEPFWGTMTVMPIEISNDKIRKVLITCQNVTDLKNRELKDQEKLQEALESANAANRSKSVFLSNMSHDIRTPMNAIMGFTTLAQNNLENPERLSDYLNKIHLASQHLLDLINDILDMSRIESGKLQLVEEPCNLNNEFQAIRVIIQEQIDAKDQILFMNTSEIRDENVICDTLRLKQIFINLLGNAVKFTPPGGKIQFSAFQKEQGDNTFGLYEFHIKDNGIGMSQEFLDRIFDPFERERTSTISRTQGTGLGMSITKNIISLLNGTIDIETAPNKGTEVIVTLPLKKDTSASVSLCTEETANTLLNPSHINSSIKNYRILLVEDNVLNREIATEILNDYGLIVETAEDGKQAIHLLEKNPADYYDLIFMDIQMPVMDGYEATRKIRSLPDSVLANITIVAMTANAFEEDRKKAYDAGMNDFLGKPIEVSSLQKILDTYLKD